MAAPSYQAAGEGTISSGGTANVPYPTGISAGHLLIIQGMYNAGTGPTPADWTLIYGPDGSGDNIQRLFAKSATGSESGSQAITTDDSVRARMYRFIDWLNDATMMNNFEGASLSGPTTSNTIADAGVTTTGADRLAVNFVAVADNNALDAFTGMTGGTWAEAVAEYSDSSGAPDCSLGLQTATMSSAGTIDGGTDTMSASDPWVVRGFAIIGTTSAVVGIPSLVQARRI